MITNYSITQKGVYVQEDNVRTTYYYITHGNSGHFRKLLYLKTSEDYIPEWGDDNRDLFEKVTGYDIGGNFPWCKSREDLIKFLDALVGYSNESYLILP